MFEVIYVFEKLKWNAFLLFHEFDDCDMNGSLYSMNLNRISIKIGTQIVIMCVAKTIFQKNNDILLNISHRHFDCLLILMFLRALVVIKSKQQDQSPNIYFCLQNDYFLM